LVRADGDVLASVIWGLVEEVDDDPDFIVELGRVRLLVMAQANGPEMASVTVYNGLGAGLPVTAGLTEHLLRKAHDLPFATLSLDGDGEVRIRYLMFGEAVTRENLHMLLRIFADTCDEIEDELSCSSADGGAPGRTTWGRVEALEGSPTGDLHIAGMGWRAGGQRGGSGLRLRGAWSRADWVGSRPCSAGVIAHAGHARSRGGRQGGARRRGTARVQAA
jgi:hypothetical protein